MYGKRRATLEMKKVTFCYVDVFYHTKKTL